MSILICLAAVEGAKPVQSFAQTDGGVSLIWRRKLVVGIGM